MLTLGLVMSAACGSPAGDLERAVIRGRIDDVRAILAKGVDPDTRHTMAPSPLALASEQHRDVVHVLLEAGADPNLDSGRGYSPLLAAASRGQDAIVGDLIAAGAQVNPPVNERHRTPLQSAARYGHLKVVERLLEAGADPLVRTVAGQTPRDLARIHQHSQVEAALAAAEQKRPSAAAATEPAPPAP